MLAEFAFAAAACAAGFFGGRAYGYSRGIEVGEKRPRPGEGRLHGQEEFYITVKKPRERATVVTFPRLLEMNLMNGEKAAEVWDEVTKKGRTVEVNGIEFGPDFESAIDCW